MRVSLFTVFLVGSVLLSGCATLFSGTDDEIRFQSEPSGAQVMIDGIVVGTTPTTVSVDRPGLNDTDVTVQLEGYEPRTFELKKEFNTTSILNIFFWPGFVIDAVTGALFTHDKKSYTVDLEAGTVTLNLDQLPRGDDGSYLLPDTHERIAVVDARSGLVVMFE